MPHWKVVFRAHKIVDFHHGVISSDTEIFEETVEAADARSAARKIYERDMYTFHSIIEIQPKDEKKVSLS